MPRPKNVDLDAGLTPSDEALVRSLAAVSVNQSLPKTAQVYELVRRAIVQLTMPPGAAVNERLICEALDVSRTPLREAILQLQSENLVEVRPNLGTFVSKIDLQHVFDGQLVRDALEIKVVRIAARRSTKDFSQRLDFNLHQQRVFAEERDFDRFYELDEAMHQIICEHGSSNRIWRIVTGAKAQLDRVRRLAIPEPHHLEVVLKEHTAIVDALKASDEERAVEAMRGHIGRVFQTIRHLLTQREEFFAPDSSATLERFKDM